MALTCASLAKLSEIKDLSEEDAKLIRRIWKTTNREALMAILEEEASEKLSGTVTWVNDCYNLPKVREVKRQAIDEIINTSGVEYLGTYNGRSNLQGHNVYYCNAGDNYSTTILFIGGALRVGCWADIAERNLATREEQ